MVPSLGEANGGVMKDLMDIVGKGLVLIVGLLAIVGGGTCISAFGWSVLALIGGLVMAFGAVILWLTFRPSGTVQAGRDSERRL